jgi:hypothetical protein
MSWTRSPPSCGRPGGSYMRLVLTDADGRLLFCGQTRPGSIHV